MEKKLRYLFCYLFLFVSESGFAETFNDLIYVWLNKDISSHLSESQFPITNTEEHPFLQSAIAHSGPQRRVHIVHMDLNRLARNQGLVADGFVRLGQFFEENKLNIELHDFRDICQQQDLISLIENLDNFGDSIDTVKNYMAGHLGLLGLEKAIILDFDVQLPDSLSIEMGASTVLPLLEKGGRFRIDYSGSMDHFVENGFIVVKGNQNRVFSNILDKTLSASSEYFETHNTDGVYRLFVAEFLRTLKEDEHVASSDFDLFKKYRTLRDMPASFHELSSSHLGINYERGGSWMERHKEQKVLKISARPGQFPVYSRDLQKVETLILFSRDRELQTHILGLAEKGFDFNRKIIWINGLQRQGTIFESWVDRSQVGDDPDILSESVRIMFDRGMVISHPQDLSHLKTLPESVIQELEANGFQNSVDLNSEIDDEV